MSQNNGGKMDQPNVSLFYDAEYTSFSFSEFEDMRKNGELIDCKIAVKNHCVSAHRLILAARIPLFRKLLVSSPIGAIKFEKEIDPDILESLVNYAYTGTMKITTDNVEVLLLISGYLQISKIHEACWEFLQVRLCLDNVWQTRTIADGHRRTALVEACDDYIKENFEAFSMTESLKGLPFIYLKEIISKSVVKERAEENIFEAIISWVTVSPTKRKEMLPELLQSLDGSRLKPEYLMQRVAKETFVRESLLCRDWLEEAKNYHLYQFVQAQGSIYHDVMPQPICKEQSLPMSQTSSRDSSIYAVCDSESRLSVKFLDLRRREWITLCHRYLSCVYYVFAIDEKIYIFCKSSTEIFDVKTLEWRTLETNHGSLHAAGLVLLNDMVYSFGGRKSLAHLVRCFDLKLNEWSKKAEMRKPRMFSGVTKLNESIYVTGGTFSIDPVKAGIVYSDAEKYNTLTETWDNIPPMLSCRYDHGCTSLNHKLYVCGGFSSSYLSTAEVYDPSTRKWSFISSIRAAKPLYCLISHDDKLYTLSKGPHNDSPGIDTNVYEPERNRWTSGVQMFEYNKCDSAFLVCAATPTDAEMKDADEGLD